MTLRPGRNDSWFGRLGEGFGNLGGGRGSSVGDTIESVRFTHQRNRLTRHEIRYRDGSIAIVDHLGRPYQREGGSPPRRSQGPPLQHIREAARNAAAYFHLGHARSAPQSGNPFADNFIPPASLPTYDEARRAPALPPASVEASRVPPPPPSYLDSLRTGDTAYHPPTNPRPPEPPLPPPYATFDPHPSAKPEPPREG